MLDCESCIAAVAFVREANGGQGIANPKAVAEFISQEDCSIPLVGADCQPRAGGFGSFHLSTALLSRSDEVFVEDVGCIEVAGFRRCATCFSDAVAVGLDR